MIQIWAICTGLGMQGGALVAISAMQQPNVGGSMEGMIDIGDGGRNPMIWRQGIITA